MRNLLLWMLAALLLMSSAVFAAGDDDWDDDEIIKDPPPEVTAESHDDTPAVEVDASHAGTANHMGMFFGADGYFQQGHAEDYQRSRAVDYQGQTIYFPEYGHSDSQLYENVYGPMWGVPSDAVGMEGYDPYYYYLLTMADPEQLSAEQRRQVEDYLNGVRHTEKGEAVHEHQEDVDVSEGINMSDDYWD